MVPRAPLPSEELEKGPTDGTRRRCVSAHTFGLPAARGGAAGIEGGKRKTANCQSHARMYILYNTRVREKQTKSKTCVCHNPQWLGRSAAAEHQLMLRDLARGGRRGGGGCLPVRRPCQCGGGPPPPEARRPRRALRRAASCPPHHIVAAKSALRPPAATTHPRWIHPMDPSMVWVGVCPKRDVWAGGGRAACKWPPRGGGSGQGAGEAARLCACRDPIHRGGLVQRGLAGRPGGLPRSKGGEGGGGGT